MGNRWKIIVKVIIIVIIKPQTGKLGPSARACRRAKWKYRRGVSLARDFIRMKNKNTQTPGT